MEPGVQGDGASKPPPPGAPLGTENGDQSGWGWRRTVSKAVRAPLYLAQVVTPRYNENTPLGGNLAKWRTGTYVR
jgi:hypothetical protein